MLVSNSSKVFLFQAIRFILLAIKFVIAIYIRFFTEVRYSTVESLILFFLTFTVILS